MACLPDKHAGAHHVSERVLMCLEFFKRLGGGPVLAKVGLRRRCVASWRALTIRLDVLPLRLIF